MALTLTQRKLLNQATVVWITRQSNGQPYAQIVLATAQQKRDALLPIIAELKAARQLLKDQATEAARLAQVAGFDVDLADWTAVEGEL